MIGYQQRCCSVRYLWAIRSPWRTRPHIQELACDCGCHEHGD